MEISLPDEKGRYQILQIHSSRMYENKKIAPDVDLQVRISNILKCLNLSSENYLKK